jgi:hypothetical protein
MPVSARKQLFDLSDDMANKGERPVLRRRAGGVHQGDCGLSGSSIREATGPERRADQVGHPAGRILDSP